MSLKTTENTEDRYAYGSRLLKDMGWSEGKGLGRNEDGVKEPLKVKKKFNTKGMGFNGVDDKWIEHQEKFEDILEQLNGGLESDDHGRNLSSIEERARALGGRVHYSKFLRGKDLSQKSEEDLNAVIIKRKKSKTCPVQSGQETVELSTSSTNSDGALQPMTHTSNMSYHEYFALRMKQKKEAVNTPGNGEVGRSEYAEPSSQEVETEEQRHFGRESDSKRKKKMKKESRRLSEEAVSDIRLISEGEECNSRAGEESVVGKFDKQHKRASVISNNASDITAEDIICKAERKTKKSRARESDHEDSSIPVQAETVESMLSTKIKGAVKKLKKRKLECAEDEIVNRHCKNSATSADDVMESECTVPAKKKSKSQKKVELDSTETGVSLPADGVPKGGKRKSDKKEKKRRSGSEHFLESERGTELAITVEEAVVPSDNNVEEDKKSVKKQKKLKDSQKNEDGRQWEVEDSDHAEEIKQKRKRKLKIDAIKDKASEEDERVMADLRKDKPSNAKMAAEEPAEGRQQGGQQVEMPRKTLVLKRTRKRKEEADTTKHSVDSKPFVPMTKEVAIKFARNVAYNSSIKPGKLKVATKEYMNCLKRNLLGVYSCTNLTDIPGYATKQWIELCTPVAVLALHDEESNETGPLKK